MPILSTILMLLGIGLYVAGGIYLSNASPEEAAYAFRATCWFFAAHYVLHYLTKGDD